MDKLLFEYLPILSFIGVALAITLGLVVPYLVVPKKPDAEKAVGL